MNLPMRLRHAALCAGLVVAFGAGAQPAPTRVPDTIAQRAAACIACHGREGSASNAAYFPRLAGKPAGYLFNQLRSFRDGRRFHADMNRMVQFLSDDYLREIADYFATLDLPYPAPVDTGDTSAAMRARGQALVLAGDAARGIPACVQCHGAALTGVQPGIPGLVGLPRLYLSSQLGAWVSNERHALAPDCMTQVGRKLDSADINAVASWLALQPVPADAKAVASLGHALPMPCSGLPDGARP